MKMVFGNKVTRRTTEKIKRTTERIPLKDSVALFFKTLWLSV